MSKTLGTYTAIITDQSIAADSSWTQSSGFIDVSEIRGYIGLELKVKGSTVALTDKVSLKARVTLNGTTYDDVEQAIPLGSIDSAGTTYEVDISTLQVAEPYSKVGFYISNADDTNAATVSLSYRTSSV